MNAIDLIVEDEAWSAINSLNGLIEKAFKAVSKELVDVELRPGVTAILLADDDMIADLNQRFRDRAGPTNVLSFPAQAEIENHLGDIALAYGVMEREARERGISLIDHIQHLVIHGFLHLQGYDHLTDEDAELMEAIEIRALARLGVANPYRVPDADAMSTDAPASGEQS